MKAHVGIQFNRPINKDKDYPITIGGFEVEVRGGEIYQFDFMDSEIWIDSTDPTVLHYTLTNEDIQSFPHMKDLKDHMMDIVKLVECYVYAGEESDINPTRLLYFNIIDNGNGEHGAFPISNDMVQASCCQWKSSWEIEYRLTATLVDSYKFTV